MSLFAELKRRNVFRAAAAYLALGWVITQVTATVAPVMHLPEWTLPLVVWIGVIGFPLVVVFSWVFELTPEGLKLERDVDRSASVGHVTATRLDYLAIGLFSVAIALFLVDRFAPRSAAPAPVPAVATSDAAPPAAPAPASNPATAGVPRKSIAVLPFTDLSPGHDQEYFSDGMSEELLNALAKVKDLKVAGRTSSFSFKGKNEDMRGIGKALAVANVLEGSVRKQGEKVRITAQLIQAADGYHLWSESYDGDLKDVFELQERIARAITEQLKVVLQGEQQQRLVPVATSNAEAYALYLQATGIFNRRDGARFPDAMKQLERALELDPKFARAHARLAAIGAIATIYMSLPTDLELVTEHARRASELDPTLGEPHAVLGQALVRRRRYAEARPEFEQALALEPDDVTANFWNGINLVQVGYTRRGEEQLDRVLALDPMLPNALFWRGLQYAYAGDLATAERLLQRAADAKLAFAGAGLGAIAAARGQREEAVAQTAIGLKALQIDLSDEDAARLARGTYGDAADRATAIAWIERQVQANPEHVPAVFIRSLLLMDRPARALELSAAHLTSNEASYVPLFWTSYGKAARTLPEFAMYGRKTGLAEVWDRYGEPDLCKRRAPGDYVCE